MALSDAIAALFGYRRVVVYDHSVVAASIAGMTPNDLYRRQPALRAVVSFLADNVAGVPIKCYVREGDADRPRDTTSPLALLLAHPGCGMTTYELMRATVSDLKLYGQALWYVLRDADSPSGWAIRYIPWSWVRLKDTYDGFAPSAYTVCNPRMATEAVLPASSCIRFYAYDPLGTMDASSPIEALKDVLSEQISAWEFRNGVWRNGGRVQQWISRPQGAEWTPEERNRWAKSWKSRFRGKDGTDTGGTPILEDGMRLETTQLNAREAQWVEVTRLTREDVAAVYHVNPSQIWHSESQTYASAKDNARALYADTLANDFAQIEQRINGELVRMLGMDPARNYAEFDLSAKLAASFEEQAGVLQSSVGGPWMLRNEARARMNLPALPGGDELIVPLNVTAGGLASPNDTDPTRPRLSARPIGYVMDGIVYQFPGAGEKSHPAQDVRVEPAGGGAAPFGDGAPVLLKSSSEPPADLVDELAETIARFVERQSRRVLQEIEHAGDKALAITMTKDVGDETLDLPPWWDAVRWDRELADDMEPLFRQMCDLRGVAAMADIGEAASMWDSRRTSNFVRRMAELRAALFNWGTLSDVRQALTAAEGPGDFLTAAQRAFEVGAMNRAVRGARTFATAVCGFATKEAVRQVYPRDTDRVRRTKTWRHHGSKHPRSSHAAMDGETVGLDERFSNGADYPGDMSLPAQEAVNCHCTMDVGVEKKRDPRVGSWPHGVLGSGSGGHADGKPHRLEGAWFDPDDPEQVAKTLRWCRDAIRNEPVENALVMTADGDIWHSVGVVDAVNVVGAPLDGATVIHNHPEEAGGGSFGSDDYKFLVDHPELHELWAVTKEYNFRIKLFASKHISYGEAYSRLSTDAIDDDYKHSVMEWLNEHGYVDYQRTSIQSDT